MFYLLIRPAIGIQYMAIYKLISVIYDVDRSFYISGDQCFGSVFLSPDPG